MLNLLKIEVVKINIYLIFFFWADDRYFVISEFFGIRLATWSGAICSIGYASTG